MSGESPQRYIMLADYKARLEGTNSHPSRATDGTALKSYKCSREVNIKPAHLNADTVILLASS